jgi:hypothetical protein
MGKRTEAGGNRTLICLQFKVPNEEPVLVGKYNGEKIEMTASEASGAVLNHTDPMGLEVIIPRKISADEITRAYLAPRIVGWRFYPAAKGNHRSAAANGVIAEKYAPAASFAKTTELRLRKKVKQ